MVAAYQRMAFSSRPREDAADDFDRAGDEARAVLSWFNGAYNATIARLEGASVFETVWDVDRWQNVFARSSRTDPRGGTPALYAQLADLDPGGFGRLSSDLAPTVAGLWTGSIALSIVLHELATWLQQHAPSGAPVSDESYDRGRQWLDGPLTHTLVELPSRTRADDFSPRFLLFEACKDHLLAVTHLTWRLWERQ
jgi:hypothetical protein